MFSVLLRVAAVAAVGAAVAGCERLLSDNSSSSSNTANNNSASNQRPLINDCDIIRASIIPFRPQPALSPMRELSVFQHYDFEGIYRRDYASTINGDFTQINASLRMMLRANGTSENPVLAAAVYYVGPNREIDSQNELDRIKTAYDFYSSLSGAVSRNPQNPTAIAWNNGRLTVTLRDGLIYRNSNDRIIITSVNRVLYSNLQTCIGGNEESIRLYVSTSDIY